MEAVDVAWFRYEGHDVMWATETAYGLLETLLYEAKYPAFDSGQPVQSLSSSLFVKVYTSLVYLEKKGLYMSRLRLASQVPQLPAEIRRYRHYRNCDCSPVPVPCAWSQVQERHLIGNARAVSSGGNV